MWGQSSNSYSAAPHPLPPMSVHIPVIMFRDHIKPLPFTKAWNRGSISFSLGGSGFYQVFTINRKGSQLPVIHTPYPRPSNPHPYPYPPW